MKPHNSQILYISMLLFYANEVMDKKLACKLFATMYGYKIIFSRAFSNENVAFPRTQNGCKVVIDALDLLKPHSIQQLFIRLIHEIRNLSSLRLINRTTMTSNAVTMPVTYLTDSHLPPGGTMPAFITFLCLFCQLPSRLNSMAYVSFPTSFPQFI